MSGQGYITLSLCQLQPPWPWGERWPWGQTSTAVVTPSFSPRAVIRRDRSLLRVREEFVVPEPSLNSSAGTTDDGAHSYGCVCVSPAPGSRTELFSVFHVAQPPARLAE